MKKVYLYNFDTIGNTPLVKINNLHNAGNVKIYAKLESRNPTFSVKCRIGVSMIKDAEEKGILKRGLKDKIVIEPTSGNTGIALSYVCAILGYPIWIVMPETMTIERQKLMRMFGAKIILTEGSKGMNGAVTKAQEIVASDPLKFYMPQQFKNPANPKMHEQTTAVEIWNDTGGDVDILVAGIGTGGTITGICRYFKKQKGKSIYAVGVEPSNAAVLSGIKYNKPVKILPHKIQGIGAGFKPDVLELDLIDEIITVTDEEAIETCRRLHTEEGISCGISSGAAMSAALKVANRAENEGKTIVVILPDLGERYLSTELFDIL